MPQEGALPMNCLQHTDTCERLARLESKSDGVRRDLGALQVSQTAQRDEVTARFDRFEGLLLGQAKESEERLIRQTDKAREDLTSMNNKLVTGVIKAVGVFTAALAGGLGVLWEVLKYKAMHG